MPLQPGGQTQARHAAGAHVRRRQEGTPSLLLAKDRAARASLPALTSELPGQQPAHTPAQGAQGTFAANHDEGGMALKWDYFSFMSDHQPPSSGGTGQLQGDCFYRSTRERTEAGLWPLGKGWGGSSTCSVTTSIQTPGFDPRAAPCLRLRESKGQLSGYETPESHVDESFRGRPRVRGTSDTSE